MTPLSVSAQLLPISLKERTGAGVRNTGIRTNSFPINLIVQGSASSCQWYESNLNLNLRNLRVFLQPQSRNLAIISSFRAKIPLKVTVQTGTTAQLQSDRMAHWHSGHSGQWPGYSSSHDDDDGDGDPSMGLPLLQPPQWNTVSASSGLSHTVGNTSHLQEPAGSSSGWQHQPGIVTADPSHSQYFAGGSYTALGSQPQLFTGHAFQQAAFSEVHRGTFDLAQSTPQGPTLPQTAQYPASFDPASTTQADSAYDYHNTQRAVSSLHESEYSNYQTMHSQDPAGVSYQIHDSSQNTPQFPTALNPTDSSTSQAAPAQSSQQALGAHRSHGPRPRNAIRSLVEKRPVHWRVKDARKELEITSSNIPSASTQSSRKNPTLQIESSLVDCVKDNANGLMISSLFQYSLYPTTNDIDTLADRALANAIANYKHNVLFKNTNEIVQVRKWDASVLLTNDDYLDAIVQREMNDGQVQSVCIPFGNDALVGIAEYILVDQGYHQYISLDGPDWEVALGNTFVLSAAICNWIIRRCSRDGLFQNTDFHCSENETCYNRMKDRMSSLVGNEKVEFHGLLSFMRDLLMRHSSSLTIFEPLRSLCNALYQFDLQRCNLNDHYEIGSQML
ncbi:hypothetical protein C8R48DRAFT_669301 [Suillus tomentosus]|nr:hypothetical protein C8R48DRAFT_669301 [Suillus tomentosus]